jgi:hypothetical protein
MKEKFVIIVKIEDTCTLIFHFIIIYSNMHRYKECKSRLEDE